MTPFQVLTKQMKKKSIQIFKTREKKLNPKIELGNLVRTSDIRRAFSKGDSTNYSYKLYTITEVVHDTIPSYRIDYIPERYEENLLLPTKLSLEQNNQVLKKK